VDAYLKVFIVAASAALILQAGLLLAAYLRLAKLDRDTANLRRQLDEHSGPILRNLSDVTLTVRENSRILFDDITALSLDARRQMEKFDRLTDEMADRVRGQILRLDELLTLTLNNLENAGSAVKDSVTGPVREAAAVIQGVKAALDFINARRTRQRQPGRAPDEQLFI